MLAPLSPCFGVEGVRRGLLSVAAREEGKELMYGTIARYRVKPGQDEAFLTDLQQFEGSPPPGWVYHTVFRSVDDPNELWMSVVFESAEAYKRNAESPEMDREYRRLLERLEAEPEWHDGHVIHEAMREVPTP